MKFAGKQGTQRIQPLQGGLCICDSCKLSDLLSLWGIGGMNLGGGWRNAVAREAFRCTLTVSILQEVNLG